MRDAHSKAWYQRYIDSSSVQLHLDDGGSFCFCKVIIGQQALCPDLLHQRRGQVSVTCSFTIKISLTVVLASL